MTPPTNTEAMSLDAFARDERGAVLVLWGLFLAVGFGFLALAFDIGRIATTQTQLQSFADEVALAAAGELDGEADAITRATAAAEGLIGGLQTFATGNQALDGSTDLLPLTFLSDLPADTSDTASTVTTDPTLARYVRVDISQRTVTTPFAHISAVLSGGSQLTASVTASATAGFASYACDITPLFFCMPDPSWSAENNIGDQIQLRTGNGNFWGPGNFGFINPAILPVDQTGPCAGLATNSAPLYRCLVGAERAITSCIRADQRLQTLTGQRQGLSGAFNTRFDIYQGAMGSARTDFNYRPAPNTIQGTLPNNGLCRGNNSPESEALALPRDNSINDLNRFGDGNWNRTAYVDQNHAGAFPAGTDITSTRYEMYLAEIAQANGGDILNLDETGLPQCHADGAIPDPERRVLVAAAVDCSVDPTGNTSFVAEEYVKVFMTEPVGSTGSDFDIMVEVVDTAGDGGSGALNGTYRDLVQLYR